MFDDFHDTLPSSPIRRHTRAHLPAFRRERDKLVREWFDTRLMKYPRSAVTTWDTSIHQFSSAGLSLLDKLSWFAPEPIPRSLLPEGVQQDALAELANFSFAKLDESGMKFRIHGLVQDVTREQQSSDETATSLHPLWSCSRPP